MNALRTMFSSKSERYEVVNRIATLRFDSSWREKCAIKYGSCGVIVDLCCRTGKLGFAISKRASPETVLVELDFNKTMLRESIAKKRLRHLQNPNGSTKKKMPDISYILGDVADLPLRENIVDTIAIAFGLRNLIYENRKAKKYLSELVRVIRIGGRFGCVETGQPPNYFHRLLLHIYFLDFVPLIGWLQTKHRDIYNYLGRSATNFESVENVKSILLDLGFRKVTFRHLTLAAFALFAAAK